MLLRATSPAVFLGMERSAVNRQLTTTVCAISLGAPVFVVAAQAAGSRAEVAHSRALEKTTSASLLVETTSVVEHSKIHVLAWRRNCRIMH